MSDPSQGGSEESRSPVSLNFVGGHEINRWRPLFQWLILPNRPRSFIGIRR
jgi:hypothetical protein